MAKKNPPAWLAAPRQVPLTGRRHRPQSPVRRSRSASVCADRGERHKLTNPAAKRQPAFATQSEGNQTYRGHGRRPCLIQFRHKRLDRHPTRRAIELRLRATAGGSMKRALGKTVVGSILTTAAIRYRDEPAIYCSSTDRRFSFGAVDDRVNRLTQALLGRTFAGSRSTSNTRSCTSVESRMAALPRTH
jgi:hypothetical protein